MVKLPAIRRRYKQDIIKKASHMLDKVLVEGPYDARGRAFLQQKSTLEARLSQNPEHFRVHSVNEVHLTCHVEYFTFLLQ
jgi:hypothetical protein